MKNKIFNIIIIIITLIIAYNMYMKDRVYNVKQLTLLNEYLKIPLNNIDFMDEAVIPQTTRMPECYMTFKKMNIDLDKYEKILNEHGWNLKKQYKEYNIEYRLYYKLGYVYCIRIQEDGKWGDSINYAN